jgi:hypothetical protein
MPINFQRGAASYTASSTTTTTTTTNMKTNISIPTCVASELNNNLANTCKIYTHRGNYATATMAWLQRHFGVIFTEGNDAPRGGKRGNYVTFAPNQAWLEFVADYKASKQKAADDATAAKAERMAKVEAMTISEQTAQTFRSKIEGLTSRKQIRKVANLMAASKLGFYSSEGRDKFMQLV